MGEGRKHAVLAPSAAHRWLNCHAAPAMEALMPDAATTYAAEGTMAHALCAKELKTLLGDDVRNEEREIEALSTIVEITPEMREHVAVYADVVWRTFAEEKKECRDAALCVELFVSAEQYTSHCYGTADAVIVTDRTLHIFDFKYGKGVKVDALYNPQLMIYALAAISTFYPDFIFEDVILHIIQPRLGNMSEWKVPAEALLRWAQDTLVPAADACMTGSAKCEPGAWCRFCRAKTACRALADFGLEAARKHADPRMLTPQERAQVLDSVATIKNWINAIETDSLSLALKGETIPGYKVVEGRSTRQIKNMKAAQTRFRERGVKRSIYMKAPQMKGLTEIERVLGRKAVKEMIGEFIEKPAGKPTLVPANDTRKEYSPAVADFDGIEIE